MSGLYIRGNRLEERFLEAGPEARFLLEAVLRMAVRGERWNGKKEGLGRKLKLTKEFVAEGVKDLVGAGLLVGMTDKTMRRGRPAIHYEVSDEVLCSLELVETPFSPLLDELFLGRDRPTSPRLQ